MHLGIVMIPVTDSDVQHPNAVEFGQVHHGTVDCVDGATPTTIAAITDINITITIFTIIASPITHFQFHLQHHPLVLVRCLRYSLSMWHVFVAPDRCTVYVCVVLCCIVAVTDCSCPA
jgi:hypothetical protein